VFCYRGFGVVEYWENLNLWEIPRMFQNVPESLLSFAINRFATNRYAINCVATNLGNILMERIIWRGLCEQKM
jgi:hypothetical protein